MEAQPARQRGQGAPGARHARGLRRRGRPAGDAGPGGRRQQADAAPHARRAAPPRVRRAGRRTAPTASAPPRSRSASTYLAEENLPALLHPALTALQRGDRRAGAPRRARRARGGLPRQGRAAARGPRVVRRRTAAARPRRPRWAARSCRSRTSTTRRWPGSPARDDDRAQAARARWPTPARAGSPAETEENEPGIACVAVPLLRAGPCRRGGQHHRPGRATAGRGAGRTGRRTARGAAGPAPGGPRGAGRCGPRVGPPGAVRWRGRQFAPRNRQLASRSVQACADPDASCRPQELQTSGHDEGPATPSG